MTGRPDKQPNTIWVGTEPAAGADATTTYLVVVGVDEDLSLPLSSSEAMDYARLFLTAAAAADYDAAVFRQLTEKVGVEKADAARVIGLMKGKRPQQWAWGGVTVTPGVSAQIQGFVDVEVGGRTWQWDTPDAVEHARFVLEVAAGAEFDQRYHEYLVTEMGMDPMTAREMVSDLPRFRRAAA